MYTGLLKVIRCVSSNPRFRSSNVAAIIRPYRSLVHKWRVLRAAPDLRRHGWRVGADDAAYAHEHTTGQTLVELLGGWDVVEVSKEDLKVAPEPSMYFPRVRMTPAWPAPYWKTVTPPEHGQYGWFWDEGWEGRRDRK